MGTGRHRPKYYASANQGKAAAFMFSSMAFRSEITLSAEDRQHHYSRAVTK
jgi:hypothetical protein